MASEKYATIDLGDGAVLKVEARPVSTAELVSDRAVVAKLGELTEPIEVVSREILDALKRVAPTKATVELGFGVAIEAGKLFALFGKVSGDASVKVTLEWDPGSNSASST